MCGYYHGHCYPMACYPRYAYGCYPYACYPRFAYHPYAYCCWQNVTLFSLFTHSPWFFSPSCGAACCRNEWDPHCHHWLHPCAPKAEKRFAQNMSSYLKSLADSYQHQADMIKPPRPKSAPPIQKCMTTRIGIELRKTKTALNIELPNACFTF